MSACLVSLVFGALTAKRANTQVGSTVKKGKKGYTVPVRATLLAAAITLVIGIMTVVAQKSSTLSASITLMISIVAVVMKVDDLPHLCGHLDKTSKDPWQEWELKHARMAKEELEAVHINVQQNTTAF